MPITMGLEQGLIDKIPTNFRQKYVKKRQGFDGDKGQWVAALLARNPDADPAEIAAITGATERYVRMVKTRK